MSDTPPEAAARRRTFAIISHPDAGKTTLTEKFLLYGGAVQQAGQVKARGQRRRVRSDWMELEQKRGISITSTVLRFPYRNHVLNLLDTPGHRDFSEDTYRVLAAADAAVMVLDVAKGIEAQTLKLFEVCRGRGVPLLTFLNKWDRPGLEALALLDEIERRLDLQPVPVTWPVGSAGDLRGLIEVPTRRYVRYARTSHGAVEAEETTLPAERAFEEEGAAGSSAHDELALLDEVGGELDLLRFEAGEQTPVFVGSALTNAGVRPLLDAIVDLAPAPTPRSDCDGVARKLDDPFSAFAFKVQANMDPAHRDRVAFLRICSGRFERGMVVTHQPTGKPFATKYAHSVFAQGRDTIDEGYPGDIVALVNAAEVRVGDTLYVGPPVVFPRLPQFAPEHFHHARVRDTGRFKQFRRGVAQLDEEGVVQVLRHPESGDRAPLFAAVGPMQLEVASWRLHHEFGAPAELSPTRFTVARRTAASSAPELEMLPGVEVWTRADGTRYALFESPFWLARVEQEHPELTLDKLVGEGQTS
jgi:peptide chain release factor 3